MHSKETIKKIALLTTFFFVYGCATTNAAKRPNWISGKDKRYPEETYLTGVGIGKDIDSARSAARAEILKVFEAHIEQTALDIQTESTSDMGGKSKTSEIGDAIAKKVSEM